MGCNRRCELLLSYFSKVSVIIIYGKSKVSIYGVRTSESFKAYTKEKSTVSVFHETVNLHFA
jgi:hypothetical protein